MPVKQTIPFYFGTFFITFTCYKWLALIEKVNGYDIIYNWFDHLQKQGHYINGFVTMPNHIHVLISFIATVKYQYCFAATSPAGDVALIN